MFKNSTFNIFLDTDLHNQHKKDDHTSEQIQNIQNNDNLQINHNETYDWLGLEENILYLTRIGITISISVVGIVVQCCRN